ncbi:MAG TPA: hypothetical protein VFJ13_02145 [Paracoccaceae bacterium]|nr:hypothetical protein [Paracoccaceae bacterium]
MSDQPVGAASPHRPGVPECRFCGVALMPDQAARDICGAPCCEARRAQEAARTIFQRSWQDHVGMQRLGIERAAAGVTAAVGRLGRPPEEIAFGVVPRQQGRVVPLPTARRSAFAAHLEAIVGQAFATAKPAVDLARREPCEREEAPLLDAACATCQGKCCLLGGGTHAFLTADTIQFHRVRNPDAAPAEIVAHYLSQLPEASVEHSCVYHGPRGCVLPRRERATVCNRYHCNPQSEMIRRFREMSAEAAVIVADDGEAEPAVAVFDQAGWRRVESGRDAAPGMVTRTVAAAMGQMPAELAAEERPASGRDGTDRRARGRQAAS